MKHRILTIILPFFTLIITANLQAQMDTLQSKLQTLLNQKAITPAATSVYAVWAETGKPVVAHNPTLPLIPASTVKLMTSYCAFKQLGLNHRFATKFYSNGAIQNGMVQDLWVKGKGDPSLVSERLWLAVQKLKSLGLKKITGDIYLDASYFDPLDFPGKQEKSRRAYNAPLSALSLNYNSVAIHISPNNPPHVSLFPETPYLALHNKLKSGNRDNIIIHTETSPTMEMVIVDGSIRPNAKPTILYSNITRPIEFFGLTFTKMLKESGIDFQGNIKMGLVPAKKPLWTLQSEPLSNIIKNMNKFSNNFMAEQITKYLGAKYAHPPGTTAKGIKAIQQCLIEKGIDTTDLHLENGSGLSYDNRLTAKQLVETLLAGYKDFGLSSEYIASLSVHHVDGTMRTRYPHGTLNGVLRAKTGSLNGVSSVAGYVPDKEGRIIAFAILMNKTKGSLWDTHKVQDATIQSWIK